MKKIFVVLVLFCAFFKLFADDEDKLRLAVMEFEDRSGSLSKQMLSDATEYLRGALISANKYIVIAQERQSQAMVKDMKKESYKECNDKNCQIQLGQALSADTILRTTITRLGKTFVIASELIDLEKEATVVGAREKYDGTENSMSEALDNIAEKVIAAYESIQNSEYNYAKEKSKEELSDKRAKAEAKEMFESGRAIKIAGLSTLAAGAALMVIGGGMMAGNESVMTGGFIILCTAPAIVVTGVIMTPIGAIRERKARIELNSLSVAPTKGGAYAQVGFSF